MPLRNILLSHQMMHEGCTGSAETECPPMFRQQLATEEAVTALEQAWRTLEIRAEQDGGELVLLSPAMRADVRK